MKLVKARFCLWKICEFWPHKKFRVNREQSRFVISVVRRFLDEKQKLSKHIPQEWKAEMYFLLLMMCNEIRQFSNSRWKFELWRPSSLCLALQDYFEELDLLCTRLNGLVHMTVPSMETSASLLPSLCEKDTQNILKRAASCRYRSEFKRTKKTMHTVNLTQIVLGDKSEGNVLWNVFPNDIKIVRTLVGGHMRDVFEVEWMGFGYCMKRYKLDIERARRRVDIETKLHHRGIVQAYGVLSRTDEAAFFCVLMELLPGSIRGLRSFIAERKLNQRKLSQSPFSNVVVLDILVQIARAMRYIHSQGFIHGDLNPDNVVLVHRHRRSAGIGSGLGSGDLLKSCGYGEYITVKIRGFGESKQATGEYEKAADVYDFGITAFEVVSGIERSRVWLRERERVCEKESVCFWKGFRSQDSFFIQLKDAFLAQCLSPLPAARPSLNQVCGELLLLKSQELQKVSQKKRATDPNFGNGETPRSSCPS